MSDNTPLPTGPWRLDTDNLTLIIGLDRGMPRMIYWGARLPDTQSAHTLVAALARPAVPGALDEPELLSLLPEHATGFGAHPGILARRNASDGLSQLRVTRVRAENVQLQFTADESIHDFSVTLTLSLDPASGVLTMSNALRNHGDTPLHVDWLASGVLALPATHGEADTLGGRWANEFLSERESIGASALTRDNRSGRSAQQRFPGVLTGSAGFGAEHGDVLAAHLAWSGNHRLVIERIRDGQPMLQLGVLLLPGELTLAPGEEWSAPPLHVARSASGYNSCMQAMHDYVRGQVLDPRRARAARLVHYNTWEACYFDHSEAQTLALIDQAKALGAERFVLDDGWFEGRDNDRAGLGNWQVCARKYPNGLEPIFDAVRDAGMQAGLWIEPEMANLDSDVARTHADWLLRDLRRIQPLGRHQYALNLCRPDVQAHLLEHIGEVVERYRLDYLKWDMNRDLAHVVVDGQPAGERMTRAANGLFAAVRQRFPDLHIEVCASGGARADFAALRHGDRIWTSDNHDPHDRQRIQRGFSLFFPPEVMGAHVGSAQSEITGRRQSLAFRIATALTGHFGIEPSRAGINADEQATLRRATNWYKTHRDWLHRARSAFIDHPEPALIVRALVADNRRRALVSAALLDTPVRPVLAPLRCVGLVDEARYSIRSLNCVTFSDEPLATLTGAALSSTGFQPPILRPDSAAIYQIEMVKETV